MCTINKLANPFVSTSIQLGTKCGCLVKRSTTTHMALQPFDQGRPITKSIDMSCQGLSRIGRVQWTGEEWERNPGNSWWGVDGDSGAGVGLDGTAT
jgi:hypothetical protein